MAAFLRCSTDHHNVLVQQAPVAFLHHTAWQVDDIDEVGRGASAMLAADPWRHAWGLGRHYIGSNFFWYLRDPAGNFSEYYSDLDCIVDDALWQPGVWEGARPVQLGAATAPVVPRPRGPRRPDGRRAPLAPMTRASRAVPSGPATRRRQAGPRVDPGRRRPARRVRPAPGPGSAGTSTCGGGRSGPGRVLGSGRGLLRPRRRRRPVLAEPAYARATWFPGPG